MKRSSCPLLIIAGLWLSVFLPLVGPLLYIKRGTGPTSPPAVRLRYYLARSGRRPLLDSPRRRAGADERDRLESG